MAEQIFPTKGNLLALKKNLSLAKLGFDLLDRKRNVLMREMMQRIDAAAALQQDIGDAFSRAYKALEHANVTMGINKTLEVYAPEEDGFSLTSRSVMGVELPTTDFVTTSPPLPLYGFYHTNIELDYATVCFAKVKELCARLAGVQNSVYRLAAAIKKVQRRANMLENIVIPRYEDNVKFITGVLEEHDREEFSRLKVIKKSKQSAQGIMD